MNARFIVLSASRVSRSDARLAVLRTFHELPADVDIEVVVNAPVTDGLIYVFDRERLKESVGG